MTPPLVCQVCDEQVFEFPYDEAPACRACMVKLGPCLAVACAHPSEDVGLFVAVLRSGRVIKFAGAIVYGDWITADGVSLQDKNGDAPVHTGIVRNGCVVKQEKHFYEFSFRLSEVAYAYMEGDA